MKKLIKPSPSMRGSKVESETIKTKSGHEILVDKEDHNFLSRFTWCVSKSSSGTLYAKTNGSHKTTRVDLLTNGVSLQVWGNAGDP
jgi:hypothetical protein